ncbi:MAG: hypothetical protein HC819_23525 [Cyclobacteriaceae bacterium]|nr:hypothetical protein [Cyclobacteriaceae bacterium]
MKRFLFSIGFYILISGVIPLWVAAQDRGLEYFPTPNTRLGATPNPKKQRKGEKTIRFIIVNNTKGTLAGNRCFEEALAKMGFQYLAMPKGQPPNQNGFARWTHNFGVKFMIVLQNGPFWKSRVNKKYKECKYGSGDYVG